MHQLCDVIADINKALRLLHRRPPCQDLVLNSRLWVRRLQINRSLIHWVYPAPKVNDGTCLKKSGHLGLLGENFRKVITIEGASIFFTN